MHLRWKLIVLVSVSLLSFAAGQAMAAPTISSLSPTSGAVGASVTIAGSNFGSTQGSSTVKFNGTTATITSWSASSIVAKVPTGATTGNVVVTVSGVASNGKSFTVLPTPSITSLSPTSGAVGASVTIAGTNFGSSQGSSTVKFNGTTATVTSWGASSIVATVPSGATTGNVVVNASGVNTNGKSFTVVGAPSITSLTPTSGAVGTSVTVAGSNFGSSQGSSTVKFNGTAATVTSWNAGSIVATVPSGATTGNVIVHASGVDSNGKSFTVLPTPSITSLSPTSGTVSTSVTITGTNFGGTQGSSTVKFNGTVATPTTWGATSIVVPVPSSATTGNVVVTVSGVASNGSNFTVITLTSIAVTPQNPAIASGNTQQFTATGTYSNNSMQNLTATAIWTSSATGVATINSSGLATAVGPGQTTIQASVGSVHGSTLLAVPGFVPTGSLHIGRGTHTATLLNNGKVLIAGGFDNSNTTQASAELYDPSTGIFSLTGNMTSSRVFHAAVLLNDGRVLITGGQGSSGQALASAELYDPAMGTFTATGSLGTARQVHTAIPLSNGKILIAGGSDTSFRSTSSVELYDPATGTFTSTGSLNAARQAHVAILLGNGRVLVAGGLANDSTTVLASAELYDPVAGTFTATGNLSVARESYTGTLLNSGRILVAGGWNVSAGFLASAELYDPTTGTFTATGSLSSTRSYHKATLLTNGMVSITGGSGVAGNGQASAELYDPVAGTFTPGGTLNTGRDTHTATRLNSGMVLISGGYDASGSSLASAELYQPATYAPVNLVSIAVSPLNPAIPAGTAQSLTATGTFSDNSTQTLASVTWSSSNTAIVTLTNDSSNHGIAFGVAIGSATVSACTGSICGSTIVTVVAPDPDITALSPNSGPVGSSLTIAGAGFGAIQGSSTVLLNQTAATVTSWTPANVVVTVPNETTGNIAVQVGGVTSNLVEFTVLATPAISSVSPMSGDIGSTVQISGANFGDSQGSSTATLNGVAINVTTWSATSITGIVPAGATTGNMIITVGGVPSNPVSYTVLNVPAIFSLSPTLGPPGTMVTMTGANFGTAQGSSTVAFNGLVATVTGWNATSIGAIVPPGATTGAVVVNVAGTLSNGVVFVVPGHPNISGLSLTTAPVGWPVTITGTNFGASQGTSTVSFNGTLVATTSWSLTQIGVTVPPGATSGIVTVTALGVTGTAAFFNVFTGPTISSVNRMSGQVGDSNILIQGSNFGATQGLSTVTFNGAPAIISGWADTGISVQVPTGATTGALAVTVFGISKSAGTFTVFPTPVITSVSPSSGVVGTPITITGSGFGASQGSGGVLFPGVGGYAPVTTWSDTSIVFPVPAGQVFSGYVFVRASEGLFQTTGNSNLVFFTVLPSINSLSPSSGTVATLVQINGAGFGFDQTTGTVTFNGKLATPISWSLNQIVAYPPVGATTGNVVVTVSGNSSAGANFTVQPGPAIATLSPTNGVVGTSVTITGTGFGSPQGSSTVTFNGTTALPTVWNGTSITVPVPTGATSGNVVVTVAGVASNGVSFTLDSAPSISSLSQTSGSVGTLITIFGSNFLDTQGSSTVNFNGTAATPTSWSANTIVVPVPTGATTGNVVVTVLGQASAGVRFTVTAAPNISSLSPSSGPAGILVSVNGSNFGSSQGASVVTFNGVFALPTSWASGLIKVPVPPGATSGPVVVVVSNGSSNGSTFTLTAGPGITSVSPTSGGIGATVTITGVGFGASQGSSTVKFNGTTAVPTNWSDGLITVPVPTGATTGNVVVSVGGTASNGVSFTVASGLSVTSVTPNSGNTGETMTITGTGFGSSQGSSTIKFNGTTATATSWTNTSITTSVPAAATSGPLVVTVGGAQSDGVNFTAQPQITGITPNPAALDASVTITGENFGATQGTSVVTCSGSWRFVSSWSSSSLIVEQCTDFGPNSAVTIPVQITVNGISSAAAAINVVPDATLKGASPMTAAVGTPVVIRGKNLGATQGQSSVTINGAAATPISWSDVGIVVPVPAGAASSGQINVLVAGVYANPSIFGFTVAALPAPNSLQITPVGVNMLIGDTKQFVVMDDQHRIRYDATWTIDNSSLATITTDSSPTLTAVAAGTVTLTSTVQGVTTQMPVTILSIASFPTGTVRWSAPSVAGFSPQEIVQAVPTGIGADLFSTQLSGEGTQSLVQGFTADGREVWQTSMGALSANSVADNFGGLIVTQPCNSVNPMTITDLDGLVGAQLGWVVTITPANGGGNGCPVDLPKIAVRQDGAVVVAAPANTLPSLLVLDGQSGGVVATPSIPTSTSTDATGQLISLPATMGSPVVDSDGSIYVEYELRDIPYPPTTLSSILWLLRVGPDGSTTATQLSSSDNANLFPGTLMPDGTGGVLATWTIVPPNPPAAAQPYQAAYISSGAIVSAYALPMAPAQLVNGSNGLPINPSLVSGENGTAFVSYTSNVTSFNVNSGGANWNYQAPSQSTLSIISSADSNGLVVQVTDQGGNQSNLGLDASGNLTSMPFSTRNIAPWSQGSWLGMMNSALAEIADPSAVLPPLGWDVPQGDRHKQKTPQLPIIHTFVPDAYVTDRPGHADPSSPGRLVKFLYDQFGGRAQVRGFPSGAANYPAFKNDLDTPIHVLGFIGHSFELGSPGTSVGLCFAIKDPTYQHDCIIQHDSINLFSQPANPTIKPEDIQQLQLTPKIVFVATCATQAAFLKLWNIDNTTKGRALVIPQIHNITGVDLLDGATAWVAFLDSLLRGNTVGKATMDANSSIPDGIPFVVIGDPNVTIVKTKP